MNFNTFPINAFDIMVVAVLVAGILRGRKRGMSEELLDLLKWLAMVSLCAVAYKPLGEFYASQASVFSTLTCYLMAYTTVALIVLLGFAMVKRSLGGKLLGSDIFGASEYYLGMGSGLVRFVCMLLTALALLHARAFSLTELKAIEAYQNREFGSTYFPTLTSMQAMIFTKSLTGPWIQDNLGFLLITPTRGEQVQMHQKEFSLP
jgi:uncharacterized membrane protein required for colicin V production